MLASALREEQKESPSRPRDWERRGCPVAGSQLQATCSHHRCHRRTTVSTWLHPLRSQGCCYGWLFSAPSAAKLLFPFRTTPPGRAGTA